MSIFKRSRAEQNKDNRAIVPSTGMARSNENPIDESLLQGFGNNSSKLKDWFSKHGFGWNSKNGLTAFNRNFKTLGTAVPAAFQAFDAVKNFENLDDNTAATTDLLSDIRSAAANNRMLYYDLSPDQLATLRNINAGNYDNEWDLSDLSLSSLLSGGLTGALTGIAGGLPGMVVNGLAGAFNAGLSDISQGVAADNAELEALYQAIVASNQEYNDTRRQMAYNRMMR